MSTQIDQSTDNAVVTPTLGLYEMTLEVADLEASERFYRDIVGLPVIDRWGPDRPAVWLAAGRETFLGLWTREAGGDKALAQGRGGAHVHFALRVPKGTLQATRERLEARGVDFEIHSLQEESWGIYLHDPDDNVVELSEFTVLWDGSRPEIP